MTAGNGRKRGGVDTNQQIGLADEPVSEEAGKAMREWFDLAAMGAQAHETLKAIGVAKDKAMDALPGDDGAKHRYVYIDEVTGPEPVMYVVETTPPTPPSDVSFTREPKRRARVDKTEAPRGD